MVPVFQENCIFLEDVNFDKYLILLFRHKVDLESCWNFFVKKHKVDLESCWNFFVKKHKVDLESCWNFFVKKHKCQCIKAFFDDPQKVRFFYLYNFRICFAELESLTRKNGIFTLYYQLICTLVNEKYNCVSDDHGFALIYFF